MSVNCFSRSPPRRGRAPWIRSIRSPWVKWRTLRGRVPSVRQCWTRSRPFRTAPPARAGSQWGTWRTRSTWGKNNCDFFGAVLFWTFKLVKIGQQKLLPIFWGLLLHPEFFYCCRCFFLHFFKKIYLFNWTETKTIVVSLLSVVSLDVFVGELRVVLLDAKGPPDVVGVQGGGGGLVSVADLGAALKHLTFKNKCWYFVGGSALLPGCNRTLWRFPRRPSRPHRGFRASDRRSTPPKILRNAPHVFPHN